MLLIFFPVHSLHGSYLLYNMGLHIALSIEMQCQVVNSKDDHIKMYLASQCNASSPPARGEVLCNCACPAPETIPCPEGEDAFGRHPFYWKA